MSSLLEIISKGLINAGFARLSLLLLQMIWTPSPFEFVEKNNILVLSGCNMSLLVRKKSQTFLNSIFTKLFRDSTLSAEASSVVSSANKRAKSLEARGRSLIPSNTGNDTGTKSYGAERYQVFITKYYW